VRGWANQAKHEHRRVYMRTRARARGLRQSEVLELKEPVLSGKPAPRVGYSRPRART